MADEAPITVQEVVGAECGLTEDEHGQPWVVIKLVAAEGEQLDGWEDESFEKFVKYLQETHARLAELAKGS